MFSRNRAQVTDSQAPKTIPPIPPSPPTAPAEHVPTYPAGCTEMEQLTSPVFALAATSQTSHPAGTPPIRSSPSTGTALLAAGTNAGTLAGIGSSVVTCLDAPISSFIFGCLTALTAFNTFQSVRAPSTEKRTWSSLPVETSARSGIMGLVREVFRSPGVFSACQGLTYIGTAIFEITQGRVSQSLAFGAMGVGAFAVYHLVNKGYQPEARRPLSVEVAARAVFASLSPGAQDVVKNPGVYFPAANLLLIASATNFATMSSAMILVFAVSCAISAVGVAAGFLPLVSAQAPRQSGFSMVMAAINDFILAGVSLAAGFSPTGVATAFWGASALSGAIARIKQNS